MLQLKEFFEYIFGALRFWVIVEPWQSAVRVRFGKYAKVLNGGTFLRIPYFDSVYIQETRMRMISLAMQTLTTKDGKTVTITGSLGYSISNMLELYNKLYHPEETMGGLCMSMISEYVASTSAKEISMTELEEFCINKLQSYEYGIDVSFFKITNFAIVPSVRLIQDNFYMFNSLKMDDKK